MAISTKARSPKTSQAVCIDLPGESVKCWRSSDNIQVVLRKHRDVIFDLRLGTGNKYTVHSTDSDFYNARDKKLVLARQHQVVTFNDGERLHLWVTRNFIGALLLKCDGNLVMKLEPNKIDQQQYDDSPKTKSAPILITLGKQPGQAPPAASAAVKPAQIPHRRPERAAAPVDEECAVVCVMDGHLKDIPKNIAEHFKKGGGESGFADLDPNAIATSNWIWGQVAGTAAYAKDNWSWLRASIDDKTSSGIKLVRARVVKVGGKVRFYFSGYSKFNTIFGGGGFGPGHDRIMNIFAGVGKTSSSFTAAAKGIAGTFKGNALVSFVFGSATSIAEWKGDVAKDGHDLAAALFTGLLKTIIAAALVAAIVAILVLLVMVVFAASLPVIAIGALTVAVGIGVGYLVEAVDKKLGKMATGDEKNTDGMATVIAPYFRKAGNSIMENWTYLMNKFPTDYEELKF
ncbi:MAG: hypothetical protein V4857_20295 [Pseudomonadota bacterium]